MKTRASFVSNSSSSSFLVLYRDKDAFSELRHQEGYRTLIDDLGDSDDGEIEHFLAGKFSIAMYDASEIERDAREGMPVRSWRMDSRNGLNALASSLGGLTDETRKCLADGLEAAKALGRLPYDDPGRRELHDVLDALKQKFAKSMLAKAREAWPHVCVLTYADEDGEYGNYMEHEFMPLVAGRGSDGSYLVNTQSNH